MSKLYILVLLTTLSKFSTKAQDSIYYYKPDGQRLFDTSMSSNDFVAKYFDPLLRYYRWDPYFEDKRLYLDHGVRGIVFKDLTATPYGLITTKKLAPVTISKILQRFTLPQYLNSYQFYEHIKDLIKENMLSKKYVLETLGQPTRTVGANDVDDERWYFDPLKLEVSFKDTLAVDFRSKNYSGNINKRFVAVDNIKYLSIPSDKYYSVTKVINEGKVHYFMELRSEDDIYVDYAPLRIILKNGKEIRRNEDANVGSGVSKTRTYAHFYLTQAEATLLATSPVTDFKLGDVHEVLPTENSETLRAYFKVLLSMK